LHAISAKITRKLFYELIKSGKACFLVVFHIKNMESV